MYGLVDTLATTDALAAIFSDRSLLQAMIDFEVTLAAVQAEQGLIPQRASTAIRAAAVVDGFDLLAIGREARRSATLSIPFVNALTARVRASDAESAGFVHWGTTSQDLADTTLVLLLARSLAVIAVDHDRLDEMLRALSDRHARTVMLGRTLLQPAPPITFGLKVAGWQAALCRGWARVRARHEAALVLQFGGAAGTLAALGERGASVAAALASRLGLRDSGAPWHVHRDRLAAFVAAAGIYTAAIGKMARDVALLMQDEVGEVAERGGGSSSMPHKRNPAGCASALAAANRMPGLVATFLTAMIQEHERAVGGWHAEWPTVAGVIQTTGAGAAAMADVIEGLEVFPDRMRANIEKTKGVIFAERVVALVAPSAGKEAAQAIVAAALERCRTSNDTFREALAQQPDIGRWLTAEQLRSIDSPEAYLGSAEVFRVKLLSSEL